MKSMTKEILSVCTLVLLTNYLPAVCAQGLLGSFLDFASSQQPTGSSERDTFPSDVGLPPLPGPNEGTFPNDDAFPPDPLPTNTAFPQDSIFPTDTPVFPPNNSPNVKETKQSQTTNTKSTANDSTQKSSSSQTPGRSTDVLPIAGQSTNTKSTANDSTKKSSSPQNSGRSPDMLPPGRLGRLTASLLIPRQTTRRNNRQRVQGTTTPAATVQVSRSSPASNTNTAGRNNNRNIDTSSGTDASKLFPFFPNFPRGSRVINLQSGRTQTFDPLSFLEASGMRNTEIRTRPSSNTERRTRPSSNTERRTRPSSNPILPTAVPRTITRPTPTIRPVMASGIVREAAPASPNLRELVRQSLGSFGRDRSLYQALRNRRKQANSRRLRNK